MLYHDMNFSIDDAYRLGVWLRGCNAILFFILFFINIIIWSKVGTHRTSSGVYFVHIYIINTTAIIEEQTVDAKRKQLLL